MANHMTVDADVVVVGDGPAGSALALACARIGVDVMLIGPDEPWSNTYGAWLDELERCELLDGAGPVAATRCDHVIAWGRRRHELSRPYGILDNAALRSRLRREVSHHVDVVTDVELHERSATVAVGDGSDVTCRLVVDATGWPARFASATGSGPTPAWQTALGVVVDAPPDGALGEPTLMDFRSVDDDPMVTFAYSLPVADGWLVEETVLAARPAIDPDRLRRRLARRLSTDVDTMLATARRTETVRIAMGGPRPDIRQPIASFGAAAGSIHPISGYSIVASIAGAHHIAGRIAATLADPHRSPTTHAAAVWDAVWSTDQRRARVFLDYGLEMLTRLDAHQARSFFDTFFELPTDEWASFMQPGTSAGRLARTMMTVFRSASPSVRRRLLSGNPLALSRVVWPR